MATDEKHPPQLNENVMKETDGFENFDLADPSPAALMERQKGGGSIGMKYSSMTVQTKEESACFVVGGLSFASVIILYILHGFANDPFNASSQPSGTSLNGMSHRHSFIMATSRYLEERLCGKGSDTKNGARRIQMIYPPNIHPLETTHVLSVRYLFFFCAATFSFVYFVNGSCV